MTNGMTPKEKSQPSPKRQATKTEHNQADMKWGTPVNWLWTGIVTTLTIVTPTGIKCVTIGNETGNKTGVLKMLI